jgi:hypothetical protein
MPTPSPRKFLAAILGAFSILTVSATAAPAAAAPPSPVYETDESLKVSVSVVCSLQYSLYYLLQDVLAICSRPQPEYREASE